MESHGVHSQPSHFLIFILSRKVSHEGIRTHFKLKIPPGSGTFGRSDGYH
jgi:hypothetical protein